MPDVSESQLIAAGMELGVAIDSGQAQRLIEFSRLLLHWNSAFNLVSRRDTHRVVSRHLLDSLSIEPWLAPAPESPAGPQRVLDVGTGAGLPGIPLAIARPDLAFTLVDRNARKIRFVRHAARILELDHVTAIAGDAATVLDEAYATVVSRAVAQPARVWALAGTRLRPGGRMLIMRHGQADDPQTDRSDPDVPFETREVALRIPGLPIPHRLLILQPRESALARATRK